MIFKIIIAFIFIIMVAIIASIINIVLTPTAVKHNISFRSSIDLTNLPIITFYQMDKGFNVKKINFLLDTGATISVINEPILPRLDYISLNKEGTMYGHSGEIKTQKYIELDFYHKNQYYKAEMQVCDMSVAFNTLKADTGVEVHGIIGTEFFQKYKYVLDFKELEARQLK